MKYSDEQRIQKIYENADKLQNYIKEHEITKEDLLNDYSLQWLVTTPLYNIISVNMCIIFLMNINLNILIYSGL